MKPISNYSSPFQSHFNKPSRLYSIAFPSVSPFTKQEFKDECDINILMARYLATGDMPLLNDRAPQYLDVSEGFNFADMQDEVLAAKALFGELPSVLRERFANDPARFIDYCGDPENHPEMIKLGLLKKPLASPAPAVGGAGLPASGSAPVVVASTSSSST